MAIFKKTQKKEKSSSPKKEGVAVVNAGERAGAAPRVAGASALVLLRPRVTEKATDLTAKNAYVFEVDPRSNKKEIASAVKEFYKVTPIAVHTTRIPAKNVFSRGRRGKTAGGKKAVVYLKAGDKIEIV